MATSADALAIVRATAWPSTGKVYYGLACGVTVVASRPDRLACLTCHRIDCEHARAVTAYHRAHGADLLTESPVSAAAPTATPDLSAP